MKPCGPFGLMQYNSFLCVKESAECGGRGGILEDRVVEIEIHLQD